MIGIYIIENLVNHKRYIGQSANIKSRWTHHRSDLRGGYHHNCHLQDSWNKYGEENFKFDIIEECKIDELDNKENYWINYYKTYIPEYGYNFDQGGPGVRGYKHTSEEIEKMRRIQSPNIILQFDLNFQLVCRWIGGSSQIRKEFGATKESIDYRCNHQINSMSPYKGHYWVYEEEYYDSNFTWDKYLNNQIIKQVYVPSKQPFKEVICQYNYDGHLIKEYCNSFELENDGYSTHIISALLGRKAHIKTYKGFIWCYKSYDFSDGYYNDIFINQTSKTGRQKTVCQIDPNSQEIIKKYPSCTKAAEFFNTNSSCISRAAASNGTKKSMGYYWKYEQ